MRSKLMSHINAPNPLALTHSFCYNRTNVRMQEAAIMTGPKRMSEKQLAANRANAQFSTGPRTPAGRAAVRYNALKHGILAQAVVPEALQGSESREDFGQLLAALLEGFAPVNAMEELLVEQIAVAYWRLARLYRAESGAIAARRQPTAPHVIPVEVEDHLALVSGLNSYARRDRDEEIAGLEAYLNNKRELRAHMARYDANLRAATDEEVLARAEQKLAQLRAREAAVQRHAQAVAEAAQSLPAIDTALKFARYETALQNQLDRALSRLERLQRQRVGEFVAPPIQIDVSHTGEGEPGGE